MKNAITNSKKGILLVTMMFTLVSFANDASLLNETVVFKPVVRTKDNLVYVSQLCFNKTPLNVEIYFAGYGSERYESVFAEKLNDIKIIEKVYKLTGLDQGAYKIVLRSEGKEFTKFIKS